MQDVLVSESEKPSVRTASGPDIAHLAEELGVRPESVERLGVCICKRGWLFPMRDGGGIVGWRLRTWKRSKLSMKGARNGLFVPSDVSAPLVAYITEGESDLAVALDLGLAAIGRPGASACIDETVDFLRPRTFDGVTIIADNDDAGLKGAEELADALLEAGHCVRVLVPPDPFTDLREWYTEGLLTRPTFDEHVGRIRYSFPPGTPPGFLMLPNWTVRRAALIKKLRCDGFAVLIAIGSFWGSDGVCRSSRLQISALVDKSVSTVDRCLRRLKDCGVLEVVKKGYEGRANVYKIHLGPAARNSEAGDQK